MRPVDTSEYRKINTIIERDSTDASYKYALPRAVIETYQKYLHHQQVDPRNPALVSFPLGLLVEKWTQYYYPLIASSVFIPQKHG